MLIPIVCCLEARHRPTDHCVQYPEYPESSHGPSSHQPAPERRREEGAPYQGWKYPDLGRVKLVRRSLVLVKIKHVMRSLLLRAKRYAVRRTDCTES